MNKDQIAEQIYEKHAALYTSHKTIKKMIIASIVEGMGAQPIDDETLKGLHKLKDYFREHDKTPFEHWAFGFLNRLLVDNNHQNP